MMHPARRSMPFAAAALVAAATAVSAVSAVPSYAVPGRAAAGFCPVATTSAATNFHWAQRSLAPGVQLLSTSINATRGAVAVRALRVDLAQPGVGVTSLHGDLASMRVLTSLADRPQIVAATNSMYFDLRYGAPVVPFIENGQPMVLTSTPARVVGLGVGQLPEDGMVWLTGSVQSADAEMTLAAVNDVAPPVGLSVLTPAWGRHRVALPLDARSRPVVAGKITGPPGRTDVPPAGGSLLIARGAEAVMWLRSLAQGAPARVTAAVATDAPVPFVQAYGAGMQVVSQADQPRTHLECPSTEVLAARTVLAWTRSRSTLLLVTVESPRGPDGYGMDWNQLSALLTALRAAVGYTLDGGTSTEMVARLPGHPNRLSLEAAPHGDRQRPIPVGIGVRYAG